ncbi:MAG: hypothetical protein LBE12_06175 [Planctomycetaceae bacterium]|jgi:hypothetical protein|nr:hypothetical protein [Planctomycetaceae bacterium]
MNRIFYSIILLLVFFIGCDLAKPQGRKKESDGTPAMNIPASGVLLDSENSSPSNTLPQNQEAPTHEASTTETEPELSEVDAEQQQQQQNGDNNPQEPATELVKADVGAGRKGHYGQTGGEQASDIITVPVATLFRAKEMTAFRIQVPQALQLYKAMNDNKGPETHEVFMKDIIQANNIPLPELPDGHEYIYDPATEQLMIKKPK